MAEPPFMTALTEEGVVVLGNPNGCAAPLLGACCQKAAELGVLMPLLAVLVGAGIVTLVRFAYKKLATAKTDEALAQAYIRGNDFYNRMPPGGVGPF